MLLHFTIMACTQDSNSAVNPNFIQSTDAAQILDSKMHPTVKTAALQTYQYAVQNDITQATVMTIIDFQLPSTKKRLWVVDLESGETLFHEQVTHGKNSDKNNDLYVDKKNGLSNKNRSKKSSVGVFLTAETYHSSKFNGTSLRMDGLEEGFNDNARSRAIVMHPAPYADVKEGQRAGLSWGCPALDPDVSDALIETIHGGSLLLQYYPDEKWLQESEFVKGE
jgi:hypothetical protein